MIKDDFLYLLAVEPASEIINLYGESISLEAFNIPTTSRIITDALSISKTHTEIRLDFDISQQDWVGFPLSYGIKFHNSIGEYYSIKYVNDYMGFVIDRKISSDNEFNKLFNYDHFLAYHAKGPSFEWRIILDGSSIELFVDECKVSVTNTFYPSKPLDTFELMAERSPMPVLSCTITELKSIDQEKPYNISQ